MPEMNMAVMYSTVKKEPVSRVITEEGWKTQDKSNHSSFYSQLKEKQKPEGKKEKELVTAKGKESTISTKATIQGMETKKSPIARMDIEDNSGGLGNEIAKVITVDQGESSNSQTNPLFITEESISVEEIEPMEADLSVCEDTNQLMVQPSNLLPQMKPGDTTVKMAQDPEGLVNSTGYRQRDIVQTTPEVNSGAISPVWNTNSDIKSKNSQVPISDQINRQQTADSTIVIQQLYSSTDDSLVTHDKVILSHLPLKGSKEAGEGDDNGARAQLHAGNSQLIQLPENTTALPSAMVAVDKPPELESVQTAIPGNEAINKKAELKLWGKELLSNQSTKQVSQPGLTTEAKQSGDKRSFGNKPGPSTDVKKLIDFESHRLTASKLSTEIDDNQEPILKMGGDDSKTVVNALFRDEIDLPRATTNLNASDSSKSLPNAREIITQIVQKAEFLVKNNLSELKIELKPEFLGRLTIRVMVEEGIVTARFITENQQVKHMLESNLNTLRNNLESQGIRVDRTEVAVQLNNGGLFDGSEGNRQYLWEEGQSSGHHQREGPNGDNQYTSAYEEPDYSGTISEVADYGFIENGNMSFLI